MKGCVMMLILDTPSFSFYYQSAYSSQQAKVVPFVLGNLDTPMSAGSLGSIRFFTFRTPGKARSKPSRMASTSTSLYGVPHSIVVIARMSNSHRS